jgi:tRNA A37 threonylcarbamoyladenosine biosynthesis protein TsaE
LTSPTFALLMEHPGAVPVLHVDLWRLDAHELPGVGVEEALEGWPGVSLVEWGDRFPHVLPADHLDVSLADDGPGRRATVAARGPRSAAALARLAAARGA